MATLVKYLLVAVNPSALGMFELQQAAHFTLEVHLEGIHCYCEYHCYKIISGLHCKCVCLHQYVPLSELDM